MKKINLLKIKAIFMILLMLSLTFYTSIVFKNLNSNNLVKESNLETKYKFNYFDFIKQPIIQDVSAQDKVCCQKTRQSSEFQGASCIYTEETNCDLSAGSPVATSCEQTDYCKPITCINSNGQCEDNVEAAVCLALGGIARNGPSSEIAQCRQGCCNLPSGSSLITQAQCADAVRSYPNLQLSTVFDENIQDEQLCIQQSQGTEEGCCVLPDQCSFGTRSECSGGDFKLNTLCSYSPLGCPVTEKQHTECYQGKVYWYDSDGNRENVYGFTYRQDGQVVKSGEAGSCELDNQGLNNVLQCGNCEYNLGTVCDEATSGFTSQLPSNLQDKVTNQCKSLACTDLEQSKKDTSGNDINPWMSVDRRENGESWCEYQSKTGNGDDLVGSRHYLHRCVDGKEIVEGCDERRAGTTKSICIQNTLPGELIGENQDDRTYARCVPNSWEQCLQANVETLNCGLTQSEANQQYYSLYPLTPRTVHNLQVYIDSGPCKDIKQDDPQYAECVMKTACRKKTCDEEVIGTCYFNQDVGLCAPNVPPGTLGKEAEYEELSNGDTIGFSFDTKMYLAESTDLGANPEFKEDCVAGCNYDLSSFANAWNSYCTSLGDLGAGYNLIGKYSKLGFWHGGPFNQNGDVDFDEDAQAEGVTTEPFSSYTHNEEPLTGNIYALLDVLNNLRVAHLEQLRDSDFSKNYWGRVGTWLVAGGVVGGIVVLASIYVPVVGLISAEIVATSIQFLSFIPQLLVAVIAIVVVYLFLNLFFGAEQADLTYKLQCKPYSPPSRGQDCEICNDKSKFRECTEYLCNSLGKACEFKEDTENPEENIGVCFWEDQGDTLPVVIEPLPISPMELTDFIVTPSTTGRQGGYAFRETLRSFESVDIGVRTLKYDQQTRRLLNTTAECKISRNINFNYETEGQLISSGLRNEHKITIPIATTGIGPNEDRIELETGRENVFYIKCESVNGVVNTNSYFVKMRLDLGPDLSPPLITGFNLQDNSYLRYNLNQTNLILYYEDQTGVANAQIGITGGCKYSEQDESYLLMENNMTCSTTKLTSGPNQGKFTCSTNLILNPNQDNTFYFRCRDVSERRNPNVQSKSLTLRASDALLITSKSPEGDVLTTKTNLTLTTSQGAESGKSTCYYAGGIKEFVTRDLTFSASGIKFTSTNSDNHETKLSLQNEEDYLYYVWCRDIAGNEAKDVIEFRTTTPDLIIEDVSPNEQTFYTDKIQLKVVTSGGIHGDGDSTCSYNGDINGYFNEGKTTSQDRTTHVKNVTLVSSGITYNVDITCSDQYKSVTEPIEFTVNYAAFPQIIRLFRQQNVLNILLNNPAECRYSLTNANFNFNQTTTKMISSNNNLQHSVQISSSVIYIKCKDIRTNNIGPASGSYKVYP